MKMDQPRLRGENTTVRPNRNNTSGSTPLTRRKLNRRIDDIMSEGINPAYAEKTVAAADKPAEIKDQPRLRGENRGRGMFWSSCRGSTPLTRRKQVRCPADRQCQRINPAGAEKTVPSHPKHLCCRDQPRLRGENAKTQKATKAPKGSTPLTRRKLRWATTAYRLRRINPAYAEKTHRLGIYA